MRKPHRVVLKNTHTTAIIDAQKIRKADKKKNKLKLKVSSLLKKQTRASTV